MLFDKTSISISDMETQTILSRDLEDLDSEELASLLTNLEAKLHPSQSDTTFLPKFLIFGLKVKFFLEDPLLIYFSFLATCSLFAFYNRDYFVYSFGLLDIAVRIREINPLRLEQINHDLEHSQGNRLQQETAPTHHSLRDHCDLFLFQLGLFFPPGLFLESYIFR